MRPVEPSEMWRIKLRERPRVALWNHVFVPALTEAPLQRLCFVPSVQDGQVPEQNKNVHKSTNNQLHLQL
jgi:hypothetical protein